VGRQAGVPTTTAAPPGWRNGRFYRLRTHVRRAVTRDRGHHPVVNWPTAAQTAAAVDGRRLRELSRQTGDARQRLRARADVSAPPRLRVKAGVPIEPRHTPERTKLRSTTRLPRHRALHRHAARRRRGEAEEPELAQCAKRSTRKHTVPAIALHATRLRASGLAVCPSQAPRTADSQDARFCLEGAAARFVVSGRVCAARARHGVPGRSTRPRSTATARPRPCRCSRGVGAP
jgi:hypothetical protein